MIIENYSLRIAGGIVPIQDLPITIALLFANYFVGDASHVFLDSNAVTTTVSGVINGIGNIRIAGGGVQPIGNCTDLTPVVNLNVIFVSVNRDNIQQSFRGIDLAQYTIAENHVDFVVVLGVFECVGFVGRGIADVVLAQNNGSGRLAVGEVAHPQVPEQFFRDQPGRFCKSRGVATGQNPHRKRITNNVVLIINDRALDSIQIESRVGGHIEDKFVFDHVGGGNIKGVLLTQVDQFGLLVAVLPSGGGGCECIIGIGVAKIHFYPGTSGIRFSPHEVPHFGLNGVIEDLGHQARAAAMDAPKAKRNQGEREVSFHLCYREPRGLNQCGLKLEKRGEQSGARLPRCK